MKKILRQLIALVLIPSILIQACKKPSLDEDKISLINGNAPITLTMNMEDIYAALPQTIFYNISTSGLQFYTGRTQWKYGNGYVMARIPTNQGNNSYIYAVKTLQSSKIYVYAMQYKQTPNTSATSFTGTQMWIDFQNWHAYGVKYNQGVPINYMYPAKLAEPEWEECTLEYGIYDLDSNGKLVHNEDPPSGGGTLMAKPNYNCPGNVTGGGASIWDSLGGFFSDLVSGVGDLLGDVGDWLGGLFPPGGGGGTPPGGGSGWPGSGGGGWGSGYPPGGGSPGGGSGGGGGYTPPVTPDPGSDYPPLWEGPFANATTGTKYWASINDNPGGSTTPMPIAVLGSTVTSASSVYVITSPTAAFLRSLLGLSSAETNWLSTHNAEALAIRDYIVGVYVPGLTFNQKKAIAKEHLQLMISSTEYYDHIHTYTGNWWDKDSKGFTYSKKKQLELYVKINPFGALSCSDLTANTKRWSMWQEVGGYDVPVSVLNRIQDIIDANAPAYTTSNFHILPLGDAWGPAVNCDYFTVHLSTLPKNSSGVRMQPDEFLEYFRTHLSDFSGTIPFDPYYHYVAGSVNINETAKFNSAYELSLGAVVHIEIPTDEGTVVQSDYTRNTATNIHQFKFSTMKAPIDYDHPVSGNREFGIFPDADNGGYCFYIAGVDRITDQSSSWTDFFYDLLTGDDLVFEKADDLWHDIQSNLKTFVNSNDGAASSYSPYPESVRPDMDASLYYFLTGQLTLEDMKAALGCP